MKNVIVLSLAVVILVLAIIQTAQLFSVPRGVTGASVVNVAASSGGVDMSGWTADEKMMYEHHGTLPARAQKQGAPSGGMVGGC